ncbi:MAG: tripartite tricarboxylate transporter permease [Nitrospirae bacterium]|nr:tripartite tricarboxylate transporter permease [Nitrospirota bacterium]
MFDNILLGLNIAFSPGNLAFCFIGCLLGTLTGILPGLGPSGAIAILLPLTFKFSPTTAIIMLAGIYYGAMYGGSTTSILVNIPGEAASCVTCLDGYKMARQGRAGSALAIAAWGSLIGGTFGILGLQFLSPYLADVSIDFTPTEYVSLMVLGMVILVYLARESMIKGLMMAVLGLLLGAVGMDLISGKERFVYHSITLMDGIGLVPVAMGLFGITEVLENLETSLRRDVYKAKIKSLWPTKEDWKRSAGPIGRGSVIGFLLGILPGGGAILSSFTSYAIEKKVSKHPEKFGTGMIEGVAAPETANNAAAQAAFIPLFTLGLPANIVMALILGAFVMNGMPVGPLFISQHPDLFWGVIVSMYIGNIMLVILNLPLIPVWVQLLKVRYSIMFPIILVFCFLGAYSLNFNYVEVVIMVIFGVLGYVFRKLRFDPTPLVFALVLGPILERSLRQTLIISEGSWSIFVTRPISAVLLVIAAALICLNVLSAFKKMKARRKENKKTEVASPVRLS